MIDAKKIEYKSVKENEINNDFLTGFKRSQITKFVKYMDKGVLKEKPDFFVEEWDSKKLLSVTETLRRIVAEGGKLIIASFNNQVKGFVLLESNIFFDEYLNMPYIHVDSEFRGLGIGRELFSLIEKEALKLGAKKLYISGHPAVETQKFYQKMGCVLAKKINQKLYELEPLDIQLEKELIYE